MSTLTPERQTAAETNQLLSMMGVTRDDLRRITSAAPPLTEAQRERIAEISQPILRRMRRLTATGTRLRDCASLGAIIARSAAV